MGRSWLDDQLYERDDALLEALVVDDVDLNRYLVRVLLEELGYDAEPAGTPLALARTVALSLSRANPSAAADRRLPPRLGDSGASGVLHA